MSDPLWCPVRRHYCRCHDFGRRCDDFDETKDPEPISCRGMLFKDEDDAYEYFRSCEDHWLTT